MLSKSQELVSAESVQDSLLCSANHPRQSGPLGRGEIHVPMVGMWRDSFGPWSWDSVSSTPVPRISVAQNAGLEVIRRQPSPANIAYATELCSFTDDVNEQERYQFQLGRVSLEPTPIGPTCAPDFRLDAAGEPHHGRFEVSFINALNHRIVLEMASSR